MSGILQKHHASFRIFAQLLKIALPPAAAGAYYNKTLVASEIAHGPIYLCLTHDKL
jgi:hypothetical protein